VLILGIDTSGRQGSVALVRAVGVEPGAEAPALQPGTRQMLPLRPQALAGTRQMLPLRPQALAELSGGQYSELLVSTIARLLEEQGLKRSEIGLIGVASGPGSFTGLRIAIATVKGLAEAFATPVVDVTVLEALAQSLGGGSQKGTRQQTPLRPLALAQSLSGKVIAVLDAQRSEVFFGEYVLGEGIAGYPVRMIREALADFSGFTAVLAAGDASSEIITPDEAIAERLRAVGVEAKLVGRPSAEVYARIAYTKFCAGIRADVATLDANYLRRSDAEIFPVSKSGIAPA